MPKEREDEEGAKAEWVGRLEVAYGFSGVEAWWGRRPRSSVRDWVANYSLRVSIHGARETVEGTAYGFFSGFFQGGEPLAVVEQFAPERLYPVLCFGLFGRVELLLCGLIVFVDRAGEGGEGRGDLTWRCQSVS